ncbi:MAG: hypothetical protein Kow0069_11460 [Promethearchaeota archaeon]
MAAAGGPNWHFSDELYREATSEVVESGHAPLLRADVREVPGLVPGKRSFVVLWSTPTFKDVDGHYAFRVLDSRLGGLSQGGPRGGVEQTWALVPSSGNTAEGAARAAALYQAQTGARVAALLLVPEVSAYKVASEAVDWNPAAKLVVVRNSSLDELRELAVEVGAALEERAGVRAFTAGFDLKAAAHAQVALVLKDAGLLDAEACYVQAVSGGAGPAGFTDGAARLGANPEVLLVQPREEGASPLVEALDVHERGGDPLAFLSDVAHEPSKFEPTLASTNPAPAVEKLVRWKVAGGRLRTEKVSPGDLLKVRGTLARALVRTGAFSTAAQALHYFEVEKSGFLALAGAAAAALEGKLEAPNVVVNFTGRLPSNISGFHRPATPADVAAPSELVEAALGLVTREAP